MGARIVHSAAAATCKLWRMHRMARLEQMTIDENANWFPHFARMVGTFFILPTGKAVEGHLAITTVDCDDAAEAATKPCSPWFGGLSSLNVPAGTRGVGRRRFAFLR
jgi:hypothetical protein